MLERLHWPLPAVLIWGAAWGLFVMLRIWGSTPELALGVASALGIAASLLGSSWWRRAMIGLGFPLSLLLTQSASLPAWVWLVPLLALLLIYPLNAWRDAPLFPTPRHALNDLAAQAPLASNALVLDAGCGLGDGLRALRAAYPQAKFTGIEWSWPLRALCGLRCPWATVRQGDIWTEDWSGYDMVYFFQRPESMPRAVAKARAELKNGAYLVSLEFEALSLKPFTRLDTVQGKPVWIYRLPLADKELR
ncbi:MAG: class I SAM-dependent methyltransferase [Rhodoferax sp.]|jgi:SAM-dependent methyltransferase|nr:class I SAM-dependent methyltransferase [Rhodoferax sp.]